jgi:hypothetical protein
MDAREVSGEKGEVETSALTNSGADYVVLTEDIVGWKSKLRVERSITLLCMRLRLKSRMPSGRVAEAIVLPGRKHVLLGVSALEKLGAILNMKKR